MYRLRLVDFKTYGKTEPESALCLSLLGRRRACYHPWLICKTSAGRGISPILVHIANQALPMILLITDIPHLELGYF